MSKANRKIGKKVIYVKNFIKEFFGRFIDPDLYETPPGKKTLHDYIDDLTEWLEGKRGKK